MKSLEQRVLESIQEMRLVLPGDRVGVAVSGGADSVALLRILQRLRPKLGVTLLVVHFDHCLRGAESDADAEFAADLARAGGLPFVVEREDVASVATRNKWNVEDAARRLRYGFFDRVIRGGQASRIAVAHTADDQAETVLAHLIRGTGPTGLGGIYPMAGFVIRPLLTIRRDDLRSYLSAQGQSWREDSTNLDTHRVRARIRAKLLPLLERDFSPRVVERLGNLARLSREEQEFWNALIDDRFHSLVRRRDSGFSIRASDLLVPMSIPQRHDPREPRPTSEIAAMRSVTQRLIRRLYQEIRGTRQGLAAQHVEQVIRLATVSGGGHRVELPGRIVVDKDFGELTFLYKNKQRAKSSRADQPPVECSYSYAIELPSVGCATVSVPELHRRFQLKVIDWTCAERETSEGRSALDAARLQMPLILRNWRPGDAYRPRGRRQTHKLKHMFAEGRIPLRDRAGWPVLESAGQVVWARGMAPAQEFCTGDGTAAAVVIEEERL